MISTQAKHRLESAMRRINLAIFAVLWFGCPLAWSADHPALTNGEKFTTARRALIAAHWQPVVPKSRLELIGIETHLLRNGIREFESCSVDGEGYCIFRYRRGPHCLTVLTAGENLEFMRVTSWRTECADENNR